jgi:SAM-dependent methyltransferase
MAKQERRPETIMDFDRHAATWDQNPGHARRNDAVAAAIREAVPLGDGIAALEFGCGTGELTVRLAPAVGTVLATDASEGMVKVFREKLAADPLPNVKVRQLDLLSDPAPSGPFGLIYSSMTLHHIPDLPLLFGRLSSLLAPGGCIALADLCAEDGSFHGEMAVPHLGFAEEQLAELAATAGLVLNSFSTVFVVEKNDREYPVFLATLRGG